MATNLVSIIDDDESLRVAMTGLFRSRGFVAHGFASAEEFLSSSELSETSCVISDVQMPGIGGLELQAKLTAQNARIPIIFITAFPDSRIENKARDAGAICFLKKPFDGQVLMNCVERALSQPRA
jgi:FixJ family two-component response regulator